MVYQVSDVLAVNKRRILEAAKAAGATPDQGLFAVAVAMQESQQCCSSERDCGKDGTPSANYSCFNLNKDMLTMLGWNGTPDLNDEQQMAAAVGMMVKAWQQWGLDKFLAFHRGGRTAFEDGVSYGAKEYRDAIYGIVDYLRQNTQVQTNGERVAYRVEHV